MEPRKEHRSPYARARRLAAAAAICAAALFLGPPPAFAQLDPLLFLQKNQPNVIIAVDVANRMQFDANGNYFDPFDYPTHRRGVGDKPARGFGWPPRRRRTAGCTNRCSGCLRCRADVYTAELHQTLGTRARCTARSGRGRAWPWRAPGC